MAEREVSKESVRDEKPSILSEGASVALGNVFKRLVGSETRHKSTELSKKRPKTTILGQNEQVEKAMAEQAEERKRIKRAKKAKAAFENNARVIPDAATGAALEKELLAIATKGAVALFNAVATAQKSLEEKRDAKKGKKGPPVSRESFMAMMKAGLKNNAPNTVQNDGGSEAGHDEDSDDPHVARSKANWLKDDYLTKGSKTLKDWDRRADEQAADDDSDSSGDSQNKDDDVSSDASSDGSTS